MKEAYPGAKIWEGKKADDESTKCLLTPPSPKSSKEDLTQRVSSSFHGKKEEEGIKKWGNETGKEGMDQRWQAVGLGEGGVQFDRESGLYEEGRAWACNFLFLSLFYL